MIQYLQQKSNFTPLIYYFMQQFTPLIVPHLYLKIDDQISNVVLQVILTMFNIINSKIRHVY